MTEDIRILRVERTDRPKEHILIRVEQTSSIRPLDVKLIATEHEHLYLGDISGSKLSAVKADRFAGDDDELRDVLCFCLLQQKPDGAATSTLDGLELVAAENKDAFVLTVRRRLNTIISRIADIRLEQDDREEVSPFEWVDTAVAISDKLRQQIERVDAALATQQEENASLKKQLDEFLVRKEENDQEMMQKFVLLLNSKKSKIRNLQAVLKQAGLDADKITTSEAKSKHKRKAEQHQEEDVDMDDDEEPDDADEQHSTPPATDDEQDETIEEHSMPVSTDVTMRDSSQTVRPSEKRNGSQVSHAKEATPAHEDEEEEFDDEL